MNKVLRAGLLIVLLNLCLCLAPAWGAEVPEAMRPYVLRVEWVAQEARKCDFRLQVFGAAGVNEPACQVFFQAWDRASADFEAAREAIDQAITRTEDTLAQRQAWKEAERRIMHALRQIGEVMDHADFLREAENPPTPPKGKKPPKKK